MLNVSLVESMLQVAEAGCANAPCISGWRAWLGGVGANRVVVGASQPDTTFCESAVASKNKQHSH